MHKNVGATGVYIGKLEPEMREIKDDDDDTAHIAEDAPLVLKFKHANQDHEAIMVGRVLGQDKGICHDLFKDGDEEKSQAGSAAGDEEENAEQTEDVLKTSKYKFVPEVVREPKIHYWQVPRLGSFMAIPLVYKSCLSEGSIDAALADWVEISKLIETQEKEK